ncbi:MAG: tellurium resistance protein TerC [Frankiales bacterium]|nr:tellurium resistance protein TerC [Frankiales bacterium]
MLDVSLYTWVATIGGLILVLGYDQLVAHRKGEHEFSVGEALRWVGFYVGLAVAFGIGLWVVGGHQAGAEFFAGYLTEYSLSVDNLFVFVIIMSSFGVPRAYQHKVLLLGIALALVLRGGFIAVGAAAINAFVWVFFLFGAFLVYTAWKLAVAEDHDEPQERESLLARLVARVLPTVDTYDGAKIVTKVAGKRHVTPMLLVMIAIGSTDLLFALDSIPAIFGLTKEPYIVFTANAFALMGLRQLYFLLDGLLDRLVYLSKGLAVILGFIGIKLVLHAFHEYGASWAPDIGIAVSLGVIIASLAVTTVLSLRATRDRGTVRVAD